jgi:hypothetical protein
MHVHLHLTARPDVGEEAAEIAVDTEFALDADDPCWPARLVDAVTRRAHEGARELVAVAAPRGLIALAPAVPRIDRLA